MRFEFATATRIVFGEGTVKELAPAARSFGERALVVLGKSDLRIAGLIEQLKKEKLQLKDQLYVQLKKQATEKA